MSIKNNKSRESNGNYQTFFCHFAVLRKVVLLPGNIIANQMKKTFKLLALLALTAPAAWSQTIDINQADAASGTRVIATRNIKGAEPSVDDSVTKRGVVLFSAGYQSAPASGHIVETYFINLNIVHNDNRLGCLDPKKSKVVLRLEDGSTIECFQISDLNCDPVAFDGAYALMIGDQSPDTMRQNFDRLMATGIKRIDIYTTEKTLTYDIKKDFKDYLQKHFSLIDRAIKGTSK